KALQLADIVAKTLNPSGGQIDRDSSGQPTGIVRETAVDLVYAKVPPPTHEERRHALALAIQDAAAHGITSLQDYSTWDDFLAFEEMERENKLPVRVSEWLTFLDPLAVLEQQRAHHSADDPMLHTGMLKGFMDGSLGSRTAALNAPYSDDPGNIGIPQFDQATLNRMTIERAQAGFQIGFHAIGDRGVKMALDAFVAAEAALPNSMTYRCRIEHDQVVDPKDFARYKWLGVIASMQPNHLLTDMYWAEDRIGAQRAKYSYPWKTFWNQGTVLAFGTDYPVEPVTPFRGIYAAVTRKSEDGTRIYHPEQALTINQALYAYTQASAFAEHMETKKGKLLPGQFADFVVLDRDLLKATPADILKTQVLRTVVAGRTVFEADTPASPKPTGTSQPCALLNEGTYDVEKSSKSQPKRAKLVASTTGEIRCLLPANLIAGNAYWRNRWREQTVEQNSPPECRRLHRSVSGSVDGIPRQYSEDADPSHCGRTKHPVSPSGRSEVSER
ncbi:MAG: amidohydrolase, partial [Terracidiphilus sp.]